MIIDPLPVVGVRLGREDHRVGVTLEGFLRHGELNAVHVGAKIFKDLTGRAHRFFNFRIDILPEKRFCKGQTQSTHSALQPPQDIGGLLSPRGFILPVETLNVLIDQGGVFHRSGKHAYRIQ